MALAMGITILLFVFISSYSSIIAQEIASEKGTRIMEVILSSTKAQTHFYGKLTGVILVALTQIFIYGVAFVLGYSQLKNLDFMKSLLSGISPQSIFHQPLFYIRLFHYWYSRFCCFGSTLWFSCFQTRGYSKSSSAHHVYWFNRLYDRHYVWDE